MQSSATLDFNNEPVAGNWFIEPAGMLRKVRFINTCMQTIYMQYALIYVQITEEDIDIQQVLLQYQTSDTKSIEILKQLEDAKQYPPRLSLEVIRSQHAREHLRTDVTITGIKQQLSFRLFTLCPGIECII